MRFVIEQGQRLSQSMIWALQRRYFERSGIAAWRSNTVPHYITNTPLLADRYVRVIAGFLADVAIDVAQPIHVVELGAGTGRLGFHIVRAWQRQIAHRLRYVLTDFDPARLESWREHASFAPLIESGQLDVARFDAEHDDALELAMSGVRLAPGSPPANPVIVIANYVFDSLPQDCFYVDHGRLYEAVVTIDVSSRTDDVDDPAVIEDLAIRFDRGHACESPYAEPFLDRIIDGYRDRLDDAALAFPVVALRCLGRLAALASQRLLVLTADNGPISEAGVVTRREPTLSPHGSFSMPVNLHAIGEATRSLGGEMLTTRGEAESIQVCAFAIDPAVTRFEQTRAAFDDAIESRGPDQFYAFKAAFAERHHDWPLAGLLSFVAASEWDPGVLVLCLERLAELAADASDADRAAIIATVLRVRDAYVPIGEVTDFAFAIGVLLAALRCWDEAARCFHQSVARYGPDLNAVINLAICEHRLGRSDIARRRVMRVLEADPMHAAAIALVSELPPAA